MTTAREWSYTYGDPYEVLANSGTRYSLNVEYYTPRCVSCHRKRDKEERKAELQAAATELEPQIRHAIAERKQARKTGDRPAEDQWDDELERLTTLLFTR